MITVQTQEYNCEQLFRARAIILGLPEANNNHIFPIHTNRLFDLSIYLSHKKKKRRNHKSVLNFLYLDQSSTILSDLSCKCLFICII